MKIYRKSVVHIRKLGLYKGSFIIKNPLFMKENNQGKGSYNALI